MARTMFTALLFAFFFQGGSALAQTPRPVIERIDPTSGPPGTVVTVVGRALAGGRVLLGTAPIEVVSTTPNRLQVRIPAAGAASANIVVETSAGSFRGPYFRIVEARSAPVITELAPASGPPGSEVSIVGDNFSSRAVDNVVTMAGAPLVVRRATTTTLVVVVPNNATTNPFTVQVAGGASVTSPPFTVETATAITSLVPPRGAPGDELRIVGTGFSDDRRRVRVFLETRPLTVTAATTTEIRVTIPNGPATGRIVVETPGRGRVSSPAPFTVQARPEVQSFEPTGAPPGGRVVIRGRNFGADIRAIEVRLGAEVLRVRRSTDTEIEVEITERAAGGNFDVKVHELTARATQPFDVLVPVAITDFTPRSGPAGTEVTLRGRGFSRVPAENRVTLSGSAAEVISAAPDAVVVRIPAATSAPIAVAVDRNGSTRTDRPFVVTTPPTITAVEPASGAPGTEVTIRGTRFGTERGLLAVRLGERTIPLRVVEPERLVVTIPEGSTTARLSVTVRLQGTATSAEDFRVLEPFRLRVMRPPMGFPGRAVSVVGSGFVEGARVIFQGAEATPVTPLRVGPNELRVLVPEGARTGSITVELPGGARQTIERAFAVSPVPEGVGVLDLEPACLRANCDVVVRGHGFSATRNHNTVTVGGRPARVTSATTTALTIKLPRVTGEQRIHVDVRNGGSADSEPITLE
jgi:hypothetical protein